MRQDLMEQVTKEAIQKTVEEAFGGKEQLKEFAGSNLRKLLQELINHYMVSDRELFIKDQGDVGNGFYPRGLQTPMGNLDIRVPRTRKQNFRSWIIPPPYKRTDQSQEDFLNALIINGYSPNNLRNVLKHMNMGYPNQEIERISDQLRQRYYDFVQKQMPEDLFAVYIDGYRCEMRDKDNPKVGPVIIYTVIGIDVEWKKNLYGFYVQQGNETKEGWLTIFNDIISRGSKRISLIISDDFPGLKEAIAELFPKTDHQLCITHFKRNITRNMSQEDAKDFKDRFNTLKNLKDFSTALDAFSQLIIDYKEKYKSFMPLIWSKRQQYLTFIKYPQAIRKYLYTTNSSENFHRRIEFIRQKMSGFFQNQDILGINIMLQLDVLKTGKWKLANPHFKNHEYELLQMHRSKFVHSNLFDNLDLKKIEREMTEIQKNIEAHQPYSLTSNRLSYNSIRSS